MTLLDEIKSLVELGTEGDYWDYKEMWHNNKVSLLHDIICMANNQVGRDAYIIIGVSDSKSPDGVTIKGVPDTDRRDQQQLIGFLRGKKFAGGVRPTVYLKTLQLSDNEGIMREIDVIVIKDSAKTPYFLTEDFRDKDKAIKAGCIYTRIGDTNTAIDSMADVDKIEYLWRKRFGIDLSVNDKLLRLLDSPDDWVGDLNNEDYKYHKLYPEFQIHINEIEDQSQFHENSIVINIADHQINKSFYVSEVVITYHTTVLFRDYVLYLDGYRHLIPFPRTSNICKDYVYSPDTLLTYLYFDMSDIAGKLFNCFAITPKNWYYEKWDLNPGVGFLCFDDSSDKRQFDQFALANLEAINKEYADALVKKKYVKSSTTNEYYVGGWSKGNEIKALQLYEEYRGIIRSELIDKIPSLPSCGSNL